MTDPDITIRVLHIPTTVGGNPQGLSRQLRLLGVDSQTWVLQQNTFGYPADRVIWGAGDSLVAREVKRWRAIWVAATQFDIIHFNYGTSLAMPIASRKPSEKALGQKLLRRLFACYTDILQLIELSLYRVYNVALFIHYQGDDARQGDYSKAHFAHSIADHVTEDYYHGDSDAFKRRMIERMSRSCHRLYALNPDLLHVLPSGCRFVPYGHIELLEWRPEYPASAGGKPLRIGHAPSHRGVKGTEVILDALSRLKEEGYAFELVLVEGLSNREAKRIYEQVDVMIDQIYAGWYGGLAVECMALGKPVVVYIREEDLCFIPRDMAEELPFVFISPDAVLAGLRKLLNLSREELSRLGRNSRQFVEKWHDPLKIARQIYTDYQTVLKDRNRKY